MDVDRRALLHAGPAIFLLSVMRPTWAAAKVLAVRLWPSPDYSRLTLESEAELKSRFSLQASPARLTIDLDQLQLDATLQTVKSKLRADDPFIEDIQVTQAGPDKVRIVIALRQTVSVQTLKFKPIEPYQYRLVFDLHSVQEQDPLAQLMEEIHRNTPSKSPPTVLETAITDARQKAPTQADATLDPLSALLRDQAAISSPSTAASSGTAAKAAVAAAATSPKAAPRLPQPSAPVRAPVKAASTKPTAASAPNLDGATQRVIIIALDPGHGGEDPGAIGPSGTREKDVVLRIAQRLQTLINSRQVMGNPMRAFMTRDADYFVPLGTRIRKAQQVQADLFISIHADAFTNPDARGASVFALSTRGASSAAASWLARKENQADDIGGAILTRADKQTQRFLLDLSTSAQVRDSLKLGSAVVGRLSKFAKMHKNAVEQAGFAVLKSPDIPSILVETAFISNPQEEQLLRSDAYQAQIADSILQGIRAYFAQNPPLARTKQRM